MFYLWKPYVPVAARRRMAAREIQALARKGHVAVPVVVQGRAIARTFWGKAWCDNLERYSDFENRLPRGRTYVRNGSVIDLRIAPGEVAAFVSGSELYQVAVQVSEVPKARWTAIRKDCAGAIDSLVELLQGRFSRGVMERICQPKTGLFPAPVEIAFSCSCPDWAAMCKHVAAVLYGIGTRLDERPELLFRLRGVDEQELIAAAGRGRPLSAAGPGAGKVLAGEDLAELFGLEMDAAEKPPRRKPAGGSRRKKTAASRASGSRGETAVKGGRRSVGQGTKKKAKHPAKSRAKAKSRRP